MRFHDFILAFTGDMPPPVVFYKKRKEKACKITLNNAKLLTSTKRFC